MQYQLAHYKPSYTLFFKAWLADHLKNFEGKLFKWIVKDLVVNFDKTKLIYDAKINQIADLSIPSAEYKLMLLKQSIEKYDKFDDAISDLNISEIKKSFNDLKKSVFKYEAKLKIHINSNTDIIPTPDLIKHQISEIGKKSLQNHLYV